MVGKMMGVPWDGTLDKSIVVFITLGIPPFKGLQPGGSNS